MGIVSRFERTLQSAVGDTFARVFGGNVVASEIESALQQQAADGMKKIRGRKIVPNEYTVTLGTSDYQQFKADEQLAIKSFTKHLSDYIAQQGWETDGPVEVRLVERNTLHTGQFRADGERNPQQDAVQVHSASYPPAEEWAGNGAAGTAMAAGAAGAAAGQGDGWEQRPYGGNPLPPLGGQAYPQAPQDPYAAPAPQGGPQGAGSGGPGSYAAPAGAAAAGAAGGAAAAAGAAGHGSAAGTGGQGSAATGVILYLEDGSGRTFRLQRGSNLLGRGQDAHFRLPDTGVSRQHAEIRYDGRNAILSDLGSTNGTTVNGGPVQDWQLADGDLIRVGHSDILVRFG